MYNASLFLFLFNFYNLFIYCLPENVIHFMPNNGKHKYLYLAQNDYLDCKNFFFFNYKKRQESG